MDFRLIEIDDMVVYGISRPFDRRLYPQREDLRHVMWSQDEAFVPGQICEGYDGIWYGIWRDGRYMLAREKADTTYDHLEKYTLPGGAYAAFKTERGGFAWEELPRLFELIFDAWLPASGYRQKRDEMVEVYHLWTDRKIRRKNRWYEVWIPVETRKDDVCL